MSWFFNCFSAKEDEWREREIGYIRELKNTNDKIVDIVKQQSELEEHYRLEKNRWEMKEDEYIEKLNELQGMLHQQEVVTKQYQIFEGNFQQDRMQLLEVQKQIELLKQKSDNQEVLIEKLQKENKKYLDIIVDFRREGISPPGESDSGYSSEINGYGPQITKSILV